MASAKPIPDGYHAVTPYLIVNGGTRAIDFYVKAFGAREPFRMPSRTWTLAWRGPSRRARASSGRSPISSTAIATAASPIRSARSGSSRRTRKTQHAASAT